MIEDFYKNYKIALHQLCKNYNLSQEDFLHDLKSYLLSLDLSNKENTDILYLANEFAKSKYVPIVKKYICPACKFLGQQSILEEKTNLICHICNDKLKTCIDPKFIKLYKTFSNHTKTGFKCEGCKRFLPWKNNRNVICPYLDCSYTGDVKNLKKMAHPITTDEATFTSSKDHTKNDLVFKINNVIDTQINNLLFGSISFTTHNKLCALKAFKKLMDLYPEQLADYLCNNSRTGGFQHKIFQNYISILEDSFPILIRKNKKFIRVSNLLDENLCLFDGISTFTNIVNGNVISNNTQEYYIGGRKASYSKPFYIGKLLNIVNKSTNESIINDVQEYSFNKIKLKKTFTDTIVEVTHLRIPPHYQMGGMVYVNRLRKLIVDEIKLC